MTSPASWMETAKRLWPGVFVASITGMAAMFLSEHYTAPAMLFALLLGLAMSFLYQSPESQCCQGIEFAASNVLRLGVALLGLRIAIDDLIALGWHTALILVLAIASTLLLGVALAHVMGLRRRFGALTGGAVAICGASAAMAICSVMPNDERREQDTLLTIIGVTSLSTIAMIVYPIIAGQLGLSEHDAAVFLGGTIHDVAQVVGAGYSISESTGDLSTLIKLVRVSLLLPVVFCILMSLKWVGAHKQSADAKTPGVPGFLIAFIILMGVNSLGFLPVWLTDAASTVSRFALVIAIAAIGMKSNLGSLFKVGMKPIALMVIETFWIAGFILAAIFWF